MDSILEKFYNGGGGQNEANKFTQFGGLQTNRLKYTGLSHSSKSPMPVRPMSNTLNSLNHNTNYKPTNIAINTNFNHIPSQKDFLKPQNLAFNSSSDLLFSNPVQTQKRFNSEYNILQNNAYAESKKNNTKMQMMEEKMKNLELKSQRLEVINDFFFDMFENNLVKEEIEKQREKAAELQKQKNKEEGLESSSSSDSESYSNKKKKKGKKYKKNKKKDEKLNLNDLDRENFAKKDEFDPQKYQEKTFKHTKDVLENIKKNVSNYLFEEELRKNEKLQILGEEINNLKSQLVHQFDKMQMSSRHQMDKLTFCLLNSGTGNMEEVAYNLFRSDKNSKQPTLRGSMMNSRKDSRQPSQRGSIMNSRKNSILNKKSSIQNSRKGSKTSTGTKMEIPNKGAILEMIKEAPNAEINEGEDGEKNQSNLNTGRSSKI